MTEVEISGNKMVKTINGHRIHYSMMSCKKCGKERFVANTDIKRGRCRLCLACLRSRRGVEHPQWLGSWVSKSGYRMIRIQPDNPFWQMSNRGAISEHRLVIAQHLGRCLLPSEIVHHKNGIRLDNRKENLDLMPDLSKHNQLSSCSGCELRKEIRLLRWEIKELKESLQLKMRSE